MGLHICYDLHLPGDSTEADVRARVEQLHACAGALPFEKVSLVVSIAPGDPIPESSWAPRDITNFLRTWASILSEPVDAEGCRVGPRAEVAMTAAAGLVVRPGARCEAATFGLCAPMKADDAARAPGAVDHDAWYWHYCCKTQYASLVSDEHLIRCHTSLLTLLENASRIGFTVDVLRRLPAPPPPCPPPAPRAPARRRVDADRLSYTICPGASPPGPPIHGQGDTLRILMPARSARMPTRRAPRQTWRASSCS
jgi:hypothetical protein